uniref:Uncharacterized protein n=1 Tax=Anopheles merus TaxID=30066 RepID=A0A182VEZ9_ANOME
MAARAGIGAASSFGFISFTYRPTYAQTCSNGAPCGLIIRNVEAKASILASRSFGTTGTVGPSAAAVSVALLTISTGVASGAPSGKWTAGHSSLSESPPLPEDDTLAALDAAALLVAIFVFSSSCFTFASFSSSSSSQMRFWRSLGLQVADRFLQHLNVQDLHLELAVVQGLMLGSTVRRAPIRIDRVVLQ